MMDAAPATAAEKAAATACCFSIADVPLLPTPDIRLAVLCTIHIK